MKVVHIRNTRDYPWESPTLRSLGLQHSQGTVTYEITLCTSLILKSLHKRAPAELMHDVVCQRLCVTHYNRLYTCAPACSRARIPCSLRANTFLVLFGPYLLYYSERQPLFTSRLIFLETQGDWRVCARLWSSGWNVAIFSDNWSSTWLMLLQCSYKAWNWTGIIIIRGNILVTHISVNYSYTAILYIHVLVYGAVVEESDH